MGSQVSGAAPSGGGAPDGGRAFHADFLVGAKLGVGAFGAVYVARRRAEEESPEVAVKIVDLRDAAVAHPKGRQLIDKELQILKALPRSNHVVSFFDDYHEGGVVYLVMERCTSGLVQALETMPHLDESVMKLVFKDMLEGLEACHGACIVHRDVKAENFLVSPARSRLGVAVKLCDFGLACGVGSPTASDLRGVFGTAPYMAPEMLAGERYGTKVDMWAFGTLAYALLFGAWPHSPDSRSRKAMKAAILAGHPGPTYQSRPDAPAMSARAVAWLREFFERDPRRRLTAHMALAHRMFLAPWGSCDGAPLREVLVAARRYGVLDVGRDMDSWTKTDALLAACVAAERGSEGAPGAAEADIGKEETGSATAAAKEGDAPGHCVSAASTEAGSEKALSPS